MRVYKQKRMEIPTIYIYILYTYHMILNHGYYHYRQKIAQSGQRIIKKFRQGLYPPLKLNFAPENFNVWLEDDSFPVPTKTQLSNCLGTPGEDYFKGNPKSLNFSFLVIWWGKFLFWDPKKRPIFNRQTTSDARWTPIPVDPKDSRDQNFDPVTVTWFFFGGRKSKLMSKI